MRLRIHTRPVLHLLLATLSAALLILSVQFPTKAWQIQSGQSGASCVSVNDSWSSTYFFGAGGGSPWLALSGGNLTAQQTAFGSNNTVTEIGLRCNTTGKKCFDVTAIRANGSGMIWGIATASHANDQAVGGNNIGTLNSVGYNDFSAQLNWLYGGGQGSGVGLTVAGGDLIAQCFDLINGAGWIQNVTTGLNVWKGATSGAADPATNTNGFAFTPAGQTWYKAFTSAQNSGTNQGATMTNITCSGITWTMPSGFSCW